MIDQKVILCLPSRVHLEDIPCEIVLDDPGYQHLNLPIDEASKAWFEETFRGRLNAGVKPIVVTSRIYGE
jgi:hypothetical protein